MSTTAETVQYPAQPLFVECSGPPLLDQDRTSINVNTTPICDVKEEHCMLSDTENDDGLCMSDSRYLSVPSDATQTELSNDSVKYDSKRMPILTSLVPVRHPETKMIQNVFVPAEVRGESGTNIIKSILIPVQESDGTVTYVIKKVVVPIAPKLSLPAKETKFKPVMIGKKKSELIKRVEDDAKKSILVKETKPKPVRIGKKKSELIKRVEDDVKRSVLVKETKSRPVRIGKNKSEFIKWVEDDANKSILVKETKPKPVRIGKKKSELIKRVEDDVKRSVLVKETKSRPVRIGKKKSELIKWVEDDANKSILVKETKSKPVRIGRKKSELSKRLEDDVKKIEDTKAEEPKKAESVEPNEEVDLILANLRTTCPVCQRSFKSEQLVDKHVRRVHQQPFRCKKCHYSYRKEEDLAKHMKVHEEDTYHKCPFCHLKYKRTSGLRAHQIREHSNVDPVCIRDRVKEGLVKGPEDCAGRRIFVCQVCGNDYSRESYLVAHKRIAHGHQRNQARRYKCRVCKRKFTFEHNLENHLCKEPTFLCAKCGMEFNTNYALRVHTRRHTGERPYQCTVCQKSFSRTVSLRIHKITHTGERPYVCDVCGRRFTQRSSMMVHWKKHPGNHPPPPPLSLSRRMGNLSKEGKE